MKKKYTFILIVFCIAIVVINAYTIINNVFSDDSNVTNNETVNNEIIDYQNWQGIGGDNVEKTWEDEVYNYIDDLYLSVYSSDEDHGIGKDDVYSFSVSDMITEYNLSVDDFNFEGVTCNFDNSFIEIYYEDNYLMKAISIDCEKNE